MNDENYKEIYLGVILNEKNQVLIVQRAKFEKGTDSSVLTWVFPGGSKLENETPEQALKKESIEETGYQIEVGQLISERIHPQFPVRIYYYSAKITTDLPIKITDPEIAQRIWIQPKEILNYFTTNFDPGVAKFLRVVQDS